MKQLDAKAVWLFFAKFLTGSLFFGLFCSIWSTMIFAEFFLKDDYFQPRRFILWVVFLIITLSALSFIWAKLTYRFYRYELTDMGFRKESGVIYKKYVTIPYSRIQNVDIYRGILARILSLSDLHIQTAGASATVGRYGAIGVGAEGRLPALSEQDAEKLRDELISRAQVQNQIRNQGL